MNLFRHWGSRVGSSPDAVRTRKIESLERVRALQAQGGLPAYTLAGLRRAAMALEQDVRYDEEIDVDLVRSLRRP